MFSRRFRQLKVSIGFQVRGIRLSHTPDKIPDEKTRARRECQEI